MHPGQEKLPAAEVHPGQEKLLAAEVHPGQEKLPAAEWNLYIQVTTASCKLAASIVVELLVGLVVHVHCIDKAQL